MSKFIKFYPPKLEYKTTFDKSYNNKNLSNLNSKLFFGDFGILLCEKIYMRPKQVQVILFLIRRKIKHIGEIRFRSFPLRCKTKKSAGMRMGKGKGGPNLWLFCGRAGSVIFEIACHLDLEIFIESVFLSFYKMFRSKIKLIISYDEFMCIQEKNSYNAFFKR